MRYPERVKIRLLDEQTINQIAAGEVIEGPASVVKELLENARDAGATEIAVEMAGGGQRLIRVTDNGCGMSREDALLCLERHATSKISKLEDLDTLKSMGFRGEALAAIASVSKLTLISRTSAEKDLGTLLVAEGGRILQATSAERAPGTTLEVKSLFHNVPARQKFLRAPARDEAEIRDTVTRFALAHSELRLELTSEKSRLLSVLSGTSEERVRAVLGEEFQKQLLPLEAQEGDLALKGLIGQVTSHRPNRMGQYLFLNGRHVVSPEIAMAVREGYSSSLPEGRFPLFVLWLNLPGDQVDVNVHPQKREVRLRHPQEVQKFILRAVQRRLDQRAVPARGESLPRHLPWDKPWDQPLFLRETSAPQIAARSEEAPLLLSAAIESPRLLIALPGYLLLEPSSCSSLPLQGDGLCLIDQQLAHQRILFERLEQGQRAVEVERLLLPKVVQLTPAECDQIGQWKPLLTALGFDLEPFGKQAISLQAIPCDLAGVDLSRFIGEMIADLNPRSAELERRKQLVAMASRSALPRKRRLSPEEGNLLIAQLFQCQRPLTCPQGRPTLAWIDPQTIEKCFHG